MLCYDKFFKSVFKDNENILAKMISDITGIDYELLRDNVILETNEIPISRKNEKFKKCDFVIRVGRDMILNLELNKNSYTELLIKNLSYVFNLYGTVTKKGDNYNKNLKVIQININCFKDKFYEKNIPLTDFKLSNIDSNEVLTDSLIIYMLNIVKCKELYYNEVDEVPKFIKWGTLISCTDFSKIPSITKGILDEKECNLLMNKINKLTKEDYFMTKEESLEWGDWIENSIYNRALEEKQEEMIKSMIEEGATLEFVSKVTKMSIGEIEKVINE